MSNQLILIRDYNPKTDRGFVGSTWLNGLKFGNYVFRLIPDHTYLDWYGKVIDDLVDKASIKVACLQEDETVIIGFSAFDTHQEETRLHWIYVKDMWRKNGIGRMLLPKDVKVVTHITKMSLNLLPKYIQFRPYII